MIGGATLAIWGFAHDYHKDLATEQVKAVTRVLVRVLGSLGDLARGALVVLVGSYLLDAAIVSDAAHAKSLDSVMETLARRPYGPGLIGLLSAGLLCFALYSFSEAGLRRL